MVDTQHLADQIESTNKIFQLPQTSEMIRCIADLTVIYYDRLIEQGMPEAVAAQVTASYSGQIAALQK